jgi:putative transposase
MGRAQRVSAGDVIYHVLNRASGRRQIFDTPGDYQAFEQILGEAHERVAMRTLAYCLMPNHWHLVLWPRRAGELSRFVAWLTLTHTQRWHAWRGTTGTGPLYQGRFKSFPVQEDGHFLVVCRYVERNALRAGLVARAEDWRWSSLRHRMARDRPPPAWLAPWPLAAPPDWLASVNQAQTAAELEALRRCAVRGRPFGDQAWVERCAEMLGLDATLRPRGRPRKKVSDTFF